MRDRQLPNSQNVSTLRRGTAHGPPCTEPAGRVRGSMSLSRMDQRRGEAWVVFRPAEASSW
eukprot:9022712-Prorocentrum_lima.AAC.1